MIYCTIISYTITYYDRFLLAPGSRERAPPEGQLQLPAVGECGSAEALVLGISMILTLVVSLLSLLLVLLVLLLLLLLLLLLFVLLL